MELALLATFLTDFPTLCLEQETTVNTQMSQFSFGMTRVAKVFSVYFLSSMVRRSLFYLVSVC